jgi:transcriptional regulator with XRE-family HTH domain
MLDQIKNVGKFIADRRKERGMTLYQVSRRSGASYYAIKSLESGDSNVKLKNIIRILEALEEEDAPTEIIL